MFWATATTERTALTRWFLFTAALVLFATGTAKVWSAFGRTKLLAAADPITGISFGHLMLTVGVLELVIASICLFGKSQKLKLGLIGWLATDFVVYRLGLWWMGWRKPWSCLGNLTDALHLSPELADNIMKVTLAYLLLGSYGLLLWQWRQGRQVATSIKGGELRLAGANKGTVKRRIGLVIATGLLCINCAAASPPQSFKDFISTPPIITSLAYRVHFTDSFTGISGNHEWKICQLKLQANAVLLCERNVLRDFDTNGASANQRISCNYEAVYWQFLENQRVLHLWTNRAAPTAIASENLALMAGSARNEASRVLNGGIPDFPIGSVRWVDNHFTGTNTHGSVVAGELLVQPDGTPQALLFEVRNGDQSFHYVAKYSFVSDGREEGQIVPKQIDVSLVSGMMAKPYYTIFVDDVHFASGPMQAAEFYPEEHFETNFVRRVIYLGDKKVVVSPTGVQSTVLPESKPERSPGQAKARRFLVLFIIFATSGVSAAVLWTQRKNREFLKQQ